MDFISASLNKLAHNDRAPLPKIVNVTNGGIVYDTPFFFTSLLITLKNGSTSFHVIINL
jgi:hypothetical protein